MKKGFFLTLVLVGVITAAPARGQMLDHRFPLPRREVRLREDAVLAMRRPSILIGMLRHSDPLVSKAALKAVDKEGNVAILDILQRNLTPADAPESPIRQAIKILQGPSADEKLKMGDALVRALANESAYSYEYSADLLRLAELPDWRALPLIEAYQQVSFHMHDPRFNDAAMLANRRKMEPLYWAMRWRGAELSEKLMDFRYMTQNLGKSPKGIRVPGPEGGFIDVLALEGDKVVPFLEDILLDENCLSSGFRAGMIVLSLIRSESAINILRKASRLKDQKKGKLAWEELIWLNDRIAAAEAFPVVLKILRGEWPEEALEAIALGAPKATGSEVEQQAILMETFEEAVIPWFRKKQDIVPWDVEWGRDRAFMALLEEIANATNEPGNQRDRYRRLFARRILARLQRGNPAHRPHVLIEKGYSVMAPYTFFEKGYPVTPPSIFFEHENLIKPATILWEVTTPQNKAQRLRAIRDSIYSARAVAVPLLEKVAGVETDQESFIYEVTALYYLGGEGAYKALRNLEALPKVNQDGELREMVGEALTRMVREGRTAG